MSWANHDDVLGQLQDHGLDVAALEVDTWRPVRVRERDGDREKRGWYWLKTDYVAGPEGRREAIIVGSYGIYRADDAGKRNVTLNLGGRRSPLSDEQRRAIRAFQDETRRRMDAERKARQARAAARAAKVWAAYVPEGAAGYLSRKQVGAHGIRFAPNGNGTLAIPIADAKGVIHGIQLIRTDPPTGKPGKEYFPAGVAVRGHYHLIGSPRDVLLVAEGYATAATLHEATGLPVAVAFDAGNLLPVAQALHKNWPRLRLLFCADDDYLTAAKQGRNPGVDSARAAALAVDGRVVVPVFPSDRNGRKLTDFNDLALFPDAGPHLVARQVDAALAEAGWSAPPQPPRGTTPPGGTGDEPGAGRRRAVSVMALEEAIARFIPLDDGTGKHVFDSWTRKIVSRDQMVAVLPPGVRWDDVKRDPVWIGRGAVYLEEIGFDPTGRDGAIKLNTWQGWQLAPATGRCERILELIWHLCSNEPDKTEQVYDYLLRWIAYPLQHPGAKLASSLIIHGPQGTGKSAIFGSSVLAKIYGDYATVLSQRGLEDKFNADWVDSKLYLLAEEIVAPEGKWHVKNELKEFVTGEWIRVNPKNIGAYRQRNHINMVYLSNESQPIPLEADDRRHLVVWTPPPLSTRFYDDLWDEIGNGGVEAFFHFLLNLPLADFHPKQRPPDTDAKRQLIGISLDSDDRFLDEWIAGETAWPFMPCAGTDLYAAYLKWCAASGDRWPRNRAHFLAKVGRKPGWENKLYRIYTKPDPQCTEQKPVRMLMPPADLLAARQPNARYRQGAKTEVWWRTECYFAFRNILSPADLGFGD